MKPKLITICAVIFAFFSFSAVFICCKSKPKPGKDEVKQFILSFNRKVKAGKINDDEAKAINMNKLKKKSTNTIASK